MMDPDHILCWLLEQGMALHAHGDYLYVQVGYDWSQDVPGHLHRIAPGLCPVPHCVLEDDEDAAGLARLLVTQEAALREALETEPTVAFTYDVTTGTWHPEWVRVDHMGWPWVVHGEGHA